MASLYNRFRPSTWSDVVGQEEVVRPLVKQIKEGKPKNAYLFVGTRGTGKTSISYIFSKAVNCLSPVDGGPCGSCSACTSNSLDIMELDAASNNGVDDIRRIIDNSQYQPINLRYKVYIIDEVHMLSKGAFNALLKTLEQPPRYCIFILCTTEFNKVPATIKSRCEKYEFKRISIQNIVERMVFILKEEGRDYEEDALTLIASNSDGALRDALSMLDQALYSVDGIITEECVAKMIGCTNINNIILLAKTVLLNDINGSLSLLDSFVKAGTDITILINAVLQVSRDIMTLLVSPDYVIENTREYREVIKGLSDESNIENVIMTLKALNKIGGMVRSSLNPLVTLQTELAMFCINNVYDDESNILSLSARVEKLEMNVGQMITSGIVVTNEIKVESVALEKPTSIIGFFSTEARTAKSAESSFEVSQLTGTNAPVKSHENVFRENNDLQVQSSVNEDNSSLIEYPATKAQREEEALDIDSAYIKTIVSERLLDFLKDTPDADRRMEQICRGIESILSGTPSQSGTGILSEMNRYLSNEGVPMSVAIKIYNTLISGGSHKEASFESSEADIGLIPEQGSTAELATENNLVATVNTNTQIEKLKSDDCVFNSLMKNAICKVKDQIVTVYVIPDFVKVLDELYSSVLLEQCSLRLVTRDMSLYVDDAVPF